MKHGYRKGHHLKRSATYNSWRAMLGRVRYPSQDSYSNYGARGITVDETWESFVIFLKDMGERPQGKTLDRINPDGNYCKTNCRWATAKIQARNKRRI